MSNLVYGKPATEFPIKPGYYWIKGKTLANTEINCIALISVDCVKGDTIDIQGKSWTKTAFYYMFKELQYWKINEPE